LNQTVDGKTSPSLVWMALRMFFGLPLVQHAQQQPQTKGQVAGSQAGAPGPQSATFDNKLVEAGFDWVPQPSRDLETATFGSRHPS
jgi:hypothetical protein